MVFDTDVLVAHLRGQASASRAIDGEPRRAVSVITEMELTQGASGRQGVREVRRMLDGLGFVRLPLSASIGDRGLEYVRRHASSHGIGLADALIAASAIEADDALLTGNVKHFRPIRGLRLKAFRPRSG